MGAVVILGLIFAPLFSDEAALFHIPISSGRGFQLLHILDKTYLTF